MLKKFHPAWPVAFVTFLVLVVTAGIRATPSVLVVPLEDAFGWSRDQISLAIAVNVLLFGLVAPFAAALMERFGVRKVVLSALCLVTSGAFSTMFINSPLQLLATWGVIVGLGTGSMALVFGGTIANRWFVKNRGLVIGIFTASSATGQLVFLPGLAYLAENSGWQTVSLSVSIACAVMIPLVFIFLRENPASVGKLPYGAGNDWQPPVPSSISAGKLAIVSLKEASAKKDFWYLFFSFFVCGLSTSGLIGTHFIPAAHDHGMMETTAASLLALIGVFDLIGTIASGYLTDRYDPRKLLFFYYFLRGLSLFLLPIILFQTVHPSTLVFVIFYGLDWVATVPPTIMLCRTILGPDRGMVIYGWVYAAHQIGGSVAALGAAVLRVKLGDYALSFYISGAFCILSAVLVLRIAKNIPTDKLRA
jgi:MFS family permease